MRRLHIALIPAALVLFCTADWGWSAEIATALADTVAAPVTADDAAAGQAVEAEAPYAYVIPAEFEPVIGQLRQRGIDVLVLREDIELDVEVYRVRTLVPQPAGSSEPDRTDVQVERRTAARSFPAGAYLVRADRPSGQKSVPLLEPQSPDSFLRAGLFPGDIEQGSDYPVCRLPVRTPILTANLPPDGSPSGGKKPITFEALYGKEAVNFSGSPTSVLRWLEDGEHFLQYKDGDLCRVHAVSGRTAIVYSAETLAQSLEKLDGIGSDNAKRLAEQARQRLDPRGTAALLAHRNDVYYATLDGATACRLTDSPAAEELMTFSPDGRRVAFVRENDLYVVDLSSRQERRLTHNGSSTVRNGKADWVYFEEVYQRSWQAYKWSPDSHSIAFMQFDDSPVAQYSIVNHLPIRQEVETDYYPLAGQPNPTVRLGIVAAAGGDVRWVDTQAYSPDNMLITHFGWWPDSQSLYYYIQDRTQRWLDVHRLAVNNGGTTKLLREETGTWVDNPGDLTFLEDGSFLLPSEREGWKHIFHYSADGQLLRTITHGEWEAREIHAVEQPAGWIRFTGTRDSHLEEHLYQVKLDGTELRRLTAAEGSHRVSTNRQGTLFVDTWSDVRTPARVQLCRADGAVARTLDTNPVPSLAEYELGQVEMVRIALPDGNELAGSLIKPSAFDPNKKYPVWLQTYGGPHTPSLTNAWSGGRTFEQLLAQMGIVAFRVDPTSASGRGARSAWTAYQQLGVQELRDLEAACDWLAAQPYVEPDRIGISGHSYGGFLTAFALTHSRRFAAGIAGAPVTDWRNYDTIYTERFMLTPQENPEGYEKTSVVAAAKELHGRLLLIHGAMDDNVHLANTLQLAHALQQADKTFELMIYPPARHGISGMHYRRLIIDFIRRTMLE